MRAFLRLVVAGAAVFGVGACNDNLAVQNTNNPESERTLARPADVENLVGTSYLAAHNATLGTCIAPGGGSSQDAIRPQALVMSFENFSALANFSMGARVGIPRAPNDNSRGNAALLQHWRDFICGHRAARQAATGLSVANGASFSLLPPNAAGVARIRAFAHFATGVALGNIALIYDQGAAVNASNTGEVEPVPLVAYDSLMRYALAELDTAIALATGPGASGFPTPTAWFNGRALSQVEFIGLSRAYQARFAAGVARTPAERDLANWTEIRDDALAGAAALPNDFQVPMSPSAGWDNVWFVQHFASNQSNWHMMWMFIVGMADTSGAYDTWLNTARANRAPFLVRTPDRRMPQGATRDAQRLNSNVQTGGTGQPTIDVSATTNPTGAYWIAYPYIRNRSSADWTAEPLADSWYDHYRFRRFFDLTRIASFPLFTTAEMNLIAAEAHIRLGDYNSAARLINRTRVARGTLPALDTVTATSASIVPGGTACVPRIPVGPSFTSSACGSYLEALKWEKRLETAYTTPYAWFIDARGWGDLPENTPLQWATPYQEIDTRQVGDEAARPPYTYSGYGGGLSFSAARGTYGL